jgi:MoaA/NifB/PqqE/SkfB family radical SAM enzyme
MLHGWRFLSDEDKARIETGIVERRVTGGPWHAVILPTERCNAACFFCQSNAPAGSETLPWPVLKNFLEENAREDLHLIELSGGGEPLIYPQIRLLLQTCIDNGIRVEHLVTNGIRLAGLAPDIAAAGLDWVTISLNESDPARYAQMMQTEPEAFARTLEGVKAMIEARNALPAARRPRIWLQLILWKGNADHLIEMYDFARRLDVDTIFFRTIGGNHGQERIAPDELPALKSRLSEIIREDVVSGETRLHFALEHEQRLHLFTREEMARHNPPPSENFPAFHRAHPRNEFCFLPWFSAGIAARGWVFPCFEYHHPETKVLGNIRCEPMHSVWRGTRYRRFRAEIEDLMCLGGEMEASARFRPFLEPKCIDREGCQYTANLATPDFYARVAARVKPRRGRQWRAQTCDCLLRVSHRILDRLRTPANPDSVDGT